MHGGLIGGGIKGIALALGAGPAGAIDFDDPDAGLLHFAVETVSGEAVPRAGQGAAEALVIYRLPAGEVFDRDLGFGVSIRDTLAVPGGEGRYNAAIALHEDLTEAYERDRPLSRTAFGGEKTVVVMNSGLDIGIESGIAAVSDSGLNTVGPRSQVGLSVAETPRIAGRGAGGLPMTAATASLNANLDLIHVATVQTNREEDSTDTVVYAARPAVEPEDDGYLGNVQSLWGRIESAGGA